MRSFLYISAAAAGVAVALAASRESAFYPGSMPGTAAQGFDLLGEVVNVFSGVSVVRVGAMRGVNSDVLLNRNVQAFLRVIRERESSQTDAAYRTIVGGKTFSSFVDHPRIKGVCWTTQTGSRLCSTAAGAYQLTASTWDETRAAMGLPDFSPPNQDLAAVGRIAARGALADVLAGRVESAIRKLALEWEAFTRWPDPEPYKQVFLAYGGQPAGSVIA